MIADWKVGSVPPIVWSGYWYSVVWAVPSGLFLCLLTLQSQCWVLPTLSRTIWTNITSTDNESQFITALVSHIAVSWEKFHMVLTSTSYWVQPPYQWYHCTSDMYYKGVPSSGLFVSLPVCFSSLLSSMGEGRWKCLQDKKFSADNVQYHVHSQIHGSLTISSLHVLRYLLAFWEPRAE